MFRWEADGAIIHYLCSFLDSTSPELLICFALSVGRTLSSHSVVLSRPELN